MIFSGDAAIKAFFTIAFSLHVLSTAQFHIFQERVGVNDGFGLVAGGFSFPSMVWWPSRYPGRV